MREICKYGSVRGAGSNPRPYRNRRAFVAELGSAVAWGVAARAQSVVPSVGSLQGRSAAQGIDIVEALRGLTIPETLLATADEVIQ